MDKLKLFDRKQREKMDSIQEYLKSELGNSGLLIDDNDYTEIYDLRQIYYNAVGIHLIGKNGSYTRMVHDIIPFHWKKEFNSIYRACIRGDEDFKKFVVNR